MPRKRKWEKVERIKAHKWTADGFKFQVVWQGGPSRGVRWPDTWEPEKNITDDAREEYMTNIRLVDSKVVSVDIAPLVQLSRKNLAQAVAAAKTQCRPRVVSGFELPGLVLVDLAEAFLEVVRNPWQLARYMGAHEDDSEPDRELLPVLTSKDKQGVITKEVQYKKIEHVAAFLAFESFLGAHEGVGCLRYDIGRKSNEDYMVVAVPMVFKVSIDIRVKGTAATVVDYVTCHGNGKFGTLTPAGMTKGMMKEPKHFNRVLAYVKSKLPDAHGLAAKGWRELPAGSHTLPKHIAVPGCVDSSDAESEPDQECDSSGDELPN